MSRATTYLLLAAAATTAVTIYMFDPLAKPTTHSQPKFIQMNQPGDKPYMTIYNSPVYKNSQMKDPLVKDGSLKGVILTGKTFIGW